nr:MAG TPA: antitoxin [Caudoviricetes sp.]
MWLQRKRGERMGIHKGTKLTDTPKDKMLRIRIDAETENKLDEVCRHTRKSKSEVVRNGIEIQYAEIKK